MAIDTSIFLIMGAFVLNYVIIKKWYMFLFNLINVALSFLLIFSKLSDIVMAVGIVFAIIFVIKTAYDLFNNNVSNFS